MPRPLLTTPTAGPRHTIAAIGDSITHNITLGVAPHLFWPAVLAADLVTDGYRVKARNYGVSGNTSTQMLARVGQLTRHDAPKMLIVACCVNDPGNGIVAATTTANVEAMARTVAADYTLIISPQYLNWSAGGDSTSAQNATYAAVGVALQTAVTNLDADVTFAGQVAYCDLWDYMRDLIVASPGTYVANYWHTSVNNQHLNVPGQSIVADAVRARLDALGWPDLAFTGGE